jgi:hypothetical protein
MKFAVFALVASAVAALTAEEQQQHLSHIISAVDEHTKTNPRFAELKATTLIAMNSEAETGAPRSPMSEVAAMTDQMLIQTNHEINQLVLSHTKYMKNCKKKKEGYSDVIAAKRTVETNNLESGQVYRRHWESLLPRIPILEKRIADTAAQIRSENDKFGNAVAKAKARHDRFLKTIAEHDQALRDVAAIRKIIQNSNLDNRSNKAKEVSAGKKSAKEAGVKKLLEMKDNVHESLNSLVELSHASLQRESGPIDRIYALIYKTRDALLQSREKAIKEESSANSNWRTNKIAYRNDINDMEILKATFYTRIGTTKTMIGSDKKNEGNRKLTMAGAVKVKEDNQIMKNFLVVACDERQRVFSNELATKKNEKSALQAVQKKLRELKWSNKVYKAISKVSEGVVYLRDKYNIRSRLNRFLAVDGTNVVAQPDVKKKLFDAQEFNFVLNKDDLSYHIEVMKGKAKYFVCEGKGGSVTLSRRGGKSCRWNAEYEPKKTAIRIRNKVSRNGLFVDPKNGYKVTCAKQSNDRRSLFRVERPNYVSAGCYKNKVGGMLEYYMGAFSDLNTENCHERCVKKYGDKFKYFGLSEGKQCYCGNSWKRERARSSDCGLICTGREGDLCGGSFRTNVFKITKTKRIVVEDDKKVKD